MKSDDNLIRTAERGFTLIELMVAIGIIGILAGIAYPFYGDYVNRARAAAFIVQVDGWREKLAIECASSEGVPPDLEKRVLGFTTPAQHAFTDYSLNLLWNVQGATGGEKRIILAALATASSSANAIPVARMIRRELTQAGLHYRGETDIDFASVQTFGVDLGSCSALGDVPAKAPTVTAPVQAPTSSVPSLPTAANTGAPTQANTPAQGGNTANNPPANQPDPVSCTPMQTLAADGKHCVPKSCSGGRQLNANGDCVCPGHQWFNSHANKCVGNSH